jgi:DNA-binding NarL/FixJ family response regulator
VINVLLAHGVGIVRAGVRALLEQQHDIRVTEEAADCEQAVALATRTGPDLVLMDARLPGAGAFEATRRIVATQGLEGTSVLMLSASDHDDELFGALRAGASGFLVGDTGPLELLRAVRVVGRGEALLSPRVTRRVIDELAAKPDPSCPVPEVFEELTAREREVVTLVAMGLTNAEVAERLVVSRATAKTHVSRAMMKLHAHDRAKLVVLAYQGGLMQPRRAPARRVTEPGPAPARLEAVPAPLRTA